MRRSAFIGSLGVLALGAGIAAAQQERTAQQHGGARPQGEELTRLRRIHLLNWMQRDMGNLAATQAASAKVRDLGHAVAQDAAAVDGELLEYARSKAVEVNVATHPPEEMRLIESEMQGLRTLHGAAFDGRFLTDLRENDESILGAIELAQKNAGDPDLAALLQRARAAVRAHSKTAGQLEHQASARRAPPLK